MARREEGTHFMGVASPKAFLVVRRSTIARCKGNDCERNHRNLDLFELSPAMS